MSKIVANYGGGASDEYGTFKALNEAFSGQVFKGFDVVPNSTPNMTVKVNPGSGRILTGTSPSDYYYMISHDTVGGESVTIATAAASPRIDYIVAYIDKGVTGITSPVNNTNNVLKFASVAGTPAGSPLVPTTAQIQTAIGAANPYIILAQIAVAVSTTAITTPNITDLRSLIYSAAVAKTVDVNGWTVYSVGPWKQFKKRTTFTLSGSGPSAFTLSSPSLPVGISTLGSNFIDARLLKAGNAYSVVWNPEMDTTATALNATWYTPSGSASGSGSIDWTITTP